MATALQRILIFHCNLPEACGQPPLGEAASVVELQESILYYHRSAEHVHPDEVYGRASVEAVQFLGLCMALHELPSNFVRSSSPSLCTQERTKYIRLDSSTLVFVPLEEKFGNDLLAIMQVARGGGNPLAIQQSLEDHHALFCLLRGGGIMRRLAASLTKMRELYELLKRIRKAQETMSRGGVSRTSNSENSSTTGDDLEKLKRDVKALRKLLPISTIRRDLDAHYQDYVDHLGLVQSRNGGAGRCIVETVPKPIALLSASHTQMSSILTLSPSRLQTLKSATRQILDDLSSNEILGISTFCHGQLLHTHWSTSTMISHLLHVQESSSSSPVPVKVPDDQVSQIMRYMASYSMKMSLLPKQNTLSSSTPESTAKLGIQNILPSYNHQQKSTITTSEMYNIGHFLPPPPPFMLNAIDGTPSYLELSLQEKAWIVRVHLSLHVTAVPGISNDEEQQVAVWAMVYQAQDYSFLLFLGNGVRNEKVGISLVATVQLRLNDLVTQSVENSTITDQSLLDWKEPGQDVIVVDRRKNQLYLFSDRASRRPKYNNMVKNDSKLSGARSFLGLPMPRAIKNARSSMAEARPKHDAVEWAALGLDCRHFLASHLHLDVLLALDDMMNELALRRRQHHQQHYQQRLHSSDDTNFECAIAGRSTALELCTCMPLGWVYACSTVHDEKEVYAFFDSSVYVTVADVQSASFKIHEQFVGVHESTVL